MFFSTKTMVCEKVCSDSDSRCICSLSAPLRPNRQGGMAVVRCCGSASVEYNCVIKYDWTSHKFPADFIVQLLTTSAKLINNDVHHFSCANAECVRVDVRKIAKCCANQTKSNSRSYRANEFTYVSISGKVLHDAICNVPVECSSKHFKAVSVAWSREKA